MKEAYLNEAVSCIGSEFIEEALTPVRKRSRVFLSAVAAVCALAIGAAVWTTLIAGRSGERRDSSIKGGATSAAENFEAGGYTIAGKTSGAVTDEDIAHIEALTDQSAVIVEGRIGTSVYIPHQSSESDMFSAPQPESYRTIEISRVLKGKLSNETSMTLWEPGDNSLHIESKPAVSYPEGNAVWFLAEAENGTWKLLEAVPQYVAADSGEMKENELFALIISELEGNEQK